MRLFGKDKMPEPPPITTIAELNAVEPVKKVIQELPKYDEEEVRLIETYRKQKEEAAAKLKQQQEQKETTFKICSGCGAVYANPSEETM